MWPILICSIISIAVFAERLFYLHRATIHVGEFLKGLANLIKRRNFAEALHESAGTPGPVARVIHAAIIRHDLPRSELREIVQEAGQLEVPKLERFLGVLATLAYLAPLLGLLGTVAGIIEAYVTPHFPAPVRWTVAGVTGLLMLLYLGLAGLRQRVRAAPAVSPGGTG